MSDERVHFGGPDRPIGYLRDLLAERIARVTSGGSIDWVTYYFRDRRLAAALVDARRRGVDVRITLEGHPRTPRANDAAIALLADGLGPGLRVVRSRLDATPLGKLARPRLHEKLYCFSQPTPAAWVGSFNPSSDSPELDAALIEALGDHDRAHNLLVELREPALVAALVGHARRLHAERHGFLARFAPSANRELAARGCSVHYWPRVRRHPILRVLRALDGGARVRIA
ncbi:MAG TPA: phospholipase D-like domain-containing protein, partial [Myxococcota bacterium]|nr:phospholipase D-like domain-containing protein [Myxococcota bacterium]